MANVLTWADIPVLDMDRAKRFYSELLGVDLIDMSDEHGSVAVPPQDSGPIAFDLAKGDYMKPSAEGVTIYLDAGGDIDAMYKRVEAAGGTPQSPPTDMGPMIGVLAFVIDTEGNRIGLRQPSAGTP